MFSATDSYSKVPAASFHVQGVVLVTKHIDKCLLDRSVAAAAKYKILVATAENKKTNHLAIPYRIKES
jgi:hypothetical protein